jgi:hypothetical protein
MSKPTDDKPPRYGLSDEQRNNIVMSFIYAYMDGKVTVSLPDAEGLATPAGQDFLNALGRIQGVDTGQWSPMELEVYVQDFFTKIFMMASGDLPPSGEEKRKAVNQLFELLARMRLSGGLKGEFIGVATLESRLADLEAKVDDIDESLGQLRLLINNVLSNRRDDRGDSE